MTNSFPSLFQNVAETFANNNVWNSINYEMWDGGGEEPITFFRSNSRICALIFVLPTAENEITGCQFNCMDREHKPALQIKG